MPFPGYVTTAGAGTADSAWDEINRYSLLHHHREMADTNSDTLKVFGGGRRAREQRDPGYAGKRFGTGKDSPSEF